MRVGVNLLLLRPGQDGGIRQHVLGLLEQVLVVDPDIELICYVNHVVRMQEDFAHPRVKLVELPRDSKDIQPRARAGEIDVVFGAMMENGMEEAICPSVSLFVDIQHEDLPENFPPHVIEKRRRRWHWAARAAQRVCVSTQFVKDRCIDVLGIDEERFVFAPPPLGKWFREEIPDDDVIRFKEQLRCRLPKRYLLFPGNTWPHKNHIRLLEAIAQLRSMGGVPDLVLTGWPMGSHRRILAKARSLNLIQHVHWTGYLEDSWMPLLYRDAEALVFPSLYEGYGIPLIEALNTDCPVLCSNTTSCPEVVGDAALTFNPTRVEEISNAIDQVWNNEDTRTDLIERGRRRRSDIDHQAGAKNLAQVFRDVVTEYREPGVWRWGNELLVNKNSRDAKNAPLVSVITPSYQQAAFIRDTIESVQSQGYPNIEHIIVDGGSTDGTLDILRSYGDRIQWISEPDNGQADAVNKGLAMAKGEIIGWLNSDDTYLEGAVSKSVTALGKDSGCWLVYGEAYYTDEEGNVTGRYQTDTFSTGNLLRHCMICQPTVFFNRRLMEQMGKLDDRYRMAMDYELWLRYSRVTPFLYIPEYIATSRMYPENKTSKYRMQSIRESMKACRSHYRRSSLFWCRQYALAIIDKIPIVRSSRIIRNIVFVPLFMVLTVFNFMPFCLGRIIVRIHNIAQYG